MNRLERIIDLLSRLPGIGRKSASRIAYWLLETDASFAGALSRDLAELRESIRPCRECGNYAETDLCDICSSAVRDRGVLCVVEQPKDVATIEATGEYRGLYHVLHGVLSPLDGVGPEELGLGRMKGRVLREGIAEVIVATNPTLEGDSTALYVVRLLEKDGVKVSRIATGLPVGGDMEYADRLSIARAFRARQDLGE